MAEKGAPSFSYVGKKVSTEKKGDVQIVTKGPTSSPAEGYEKHW